MQDEDGPELSPEIPLSIGDWIAIQDTEYDDLEDKVKKVLTKYNVSDQDSLTKLVISIEGKYPFLNRDGVSAVDSFRILPNVYSRSKYYGGGPSSTNSKQLDLQLEIAKLKHERNDKFSELKSVHKANRGLSEKINELETLIIAKEKVDHILHRINNEAKELIFSSTDFADKFKNAVKTESIVLSIDIRRSTELMLKARAPEKYAEFIVRLSDKLAKVIIDNYGIYDKFTGDGILAFFPDFYSGVDAMRYALRAAKLCHETFNQHYSASRDAFNIFLKDIGLGIGIDYGTVSLVNYTSEFTVVGIPVVYACRMSSANAGHTLLNQPAMELVSEKYGKHCRIFETEINIKHEGVAVAYEVEMNEKSMGTIVKPDWTRLGIGLTNGTEQEKAI